MMRVSGDVETELRSAPAPEAQHSAGACRIYEYDGAYKCYTHNRVWGAVTNPDEPCTDDEHASELRRHSPAAAEARRRRRFP